MNYEPQSDDLVDMYLTQHCEERMWGSSDPRFPKLKLKEAPFTIYTSFFVHPTIPEKSVWGIKIAGGIIVGKWEKAKVGSRIKGIFIAQTALQNWQCKRSGFVATKAVQVNFRNINSQIENKKRDGKWKEPVDVSPVVSRTALDANQHHLQTA